jgi:hypothetical protein
MLPALTIKSVNNPRNGKSLRTRRKATTTMMTMTRARTSGRIVCVNKYLMGIWWLAMQLIVHMSGFIGVSFFPSLYYSRILYFFFFFFFFMEVNTMAFRNRFQLMSGTLGMSILQFMPGPCSEHSKWRENYMAERTLTSWSASSRNSCSTSHGKLTQ